MPPVAGSTFVHSRQSARIKLTFRTTVERHFCFIPVVQIIWHSHVSIALKFISSVTFMSVEASGLHMHALVQNNRQKNLHGTLTETLNRKLVHLV